ncbi:MAG: hypothetical protein JJ974_08835 [Phycisphaerales bacterium]|nr:hypothetical protein [Phycisphaerales bacterium]
MKLKGVNPFIQHIEKLVLGLAVLIFLGVISLQFVSQPNQVEVGSRSVAPDQIYNELADTARSLQSQISDRSPALPDVKPVDLVARYNQAFESSSDSTPKLASALGTGIDVASKLSVEITAESGPSQGEVAAMPVPATSTPIVATTWGTLDPYAVLELPEYADLVPAAQPFDFPSVSIESEFSGTELRKVLEGSEGYPGVPRLFWVSTGMAIMGMEVERQELQADGSWANSQIVTPPPGTATPTNAVNKNDGLARLITIIERAQQAAPMVMRPMFPPTISGPDWQAPSESQTNSSIQLSETEQAQRKLARLTAELERLRNAGRNAQRPPRDPRGGTGNRPTGRPSSNNANDQRIERLEDQIETVRNTLERLGVDAEIELEGAIDILDQDYLQLWSHDLTVKPGATYRYRSRVVLNNPYFRKGPYLDEQDPDQQALTVEPFTKGDWSDWSDPIGVGSKEFFFVTEASQPVVGAELPQARVELYSMYYGYYRRSSVTITEGQPLLTDMRVSRDLFTINTDVIEADDTAKFIDELNAGDDTERPEGLQDAPDRLSIDLDAYLIQVVNDPIASADDPNAQNLRLTFRLADGTLITRVPSMDRSSPLYEQAQSSSSKASRAKLKPTGQSAVSPAAELFKTEQP